MSEKREPKQVVNVMIDLETLGLKPGCAIIAIGAVVFASPLPTSCDDNFYSNISRSSNLFVGLKIDQDTMEWWERQSQEAKDGSLFGTDNLLITLGRFDAFLNQFPPALYDVRVWGNAASFDLKILEEAYAICQLVRPWKYYNEMCFRTLKNLTKVPEPAFIGTRHNALSDAKHQALWAEQILHKLTDLEEEYPDE